MSRDRELVSRRRPEDRPSRAGRRAPDHPVLALQQSAGNRAVARMLAGSRTLALQATGAHQKPTIKLGGLSIEVEGGNIDAWAVPGGAPDVLQVTSHKGKHSAELERLFKEHGKTDLTLTVAASNSSGSELDMGSIEIKISNAHIKGYALDGDTESWQVADFDRVDRNKKTHTVH
jgi:hypothetical protein